MQPSGQAWAQVEQPVLILQPDEALAEYSKRAAELLPDARYVSLPGVERDVFEGRDAEAPARGFEFQFSGDGRLALAIVAKAPSLYDARQIGFDRFIDRWVGWIQVEKWRNRNAEIGNELFFNQPILRHLECARRRADGFNGGQHLRGCYWNIFEFVGDHIYGVGKPA